MKGSGKPSCRRSYFGGHGKRRLFNLERIVRTKGIEVGKYRASYKISTYKLRTYKISSYLLEMIAYAMLQLEKGGFNIALK